MGTGKRIAEKMEGQNTGKEYLGWLSTMFDCIEIYCKEREIEIDVWGDLVPWITRESILSGEPTESVLSGDKR